MLFAPDGIVNRTRAPPLPQLPNGFFQSFIEVFKATEYWTVSNIEIGISALLICAEMVVFAVLHAYSFSYVPYIILDTLTPVRKSLRDGFNPMDMVREIAWACKDIGLIVMGKPLPIRDGHLSGAVKRANTVRAKNRLFRSKKSKSGSNGSEDLSITITDDPSLEAGGKFVSDDRLDDSQYGHQQPLLHHNAGQDSYEMTQQQQHQLQLQEQQQHQQQMLHQQQQFQQQQAYASRPADGYQY